MEDRAITLYFQLLHQLAVEVVLKMAQQSMAAMVVLVAVTHGTTPAAL
jgi:hypothetical protein